MEKILNILHLEDDTNDAELVQATLGADGLRCNIEIVCTREQFRSVVERGNLDLVLSDYSLPSFDGLSALQVVREIAPDVPFILVSGTIGEEAAIESLRNGATDYILKHRLSRLAPAVNRALTEAEERRARHKAESSLEKERAFLKAVLDTIEAGIVVCDANGVLTLFNRAARELHGLPEQAITPEKWAKHYRLFQPDGKTLLEKEMIPLFRALQGEHVQDVEMMIVPRDGPARTVLASARPLPHTDGRNPGAVVAMHDITERKSLEEQLRLSQKIDAVGRLAGGIAHDFNNLLNVIIGYSDLALMDLIPGHPSRDKIEQVYQAGQSAASLTRQLLAFSRKQVIEPRVLEINVVLTEIQKMLRRLIGEDIELVFRMDAKEGLVKADPGQVEQVVMNLVVNARDAMPDGGTLTIETAEVDLDQDNAPWQTGFEPGPYVTLAVSDTGTGMSPTVQARIFEPFFTTKERGRGTGLGLATVYGIVKQSGGNICVQSEVGHGTAFTIYLPRTEEPAEVSASKEVVALPVGNETILVAEDEAVIRDLIHHGLSANGYSVLLAGSGLEAEQIARNYKGQIQLLITDVIMPKMSGADLARRLLDVRPELRVLYMSGYTDDSVGQHGVPSGAVAFLQKPFSMNALARKVREVLDAPERTLAGSSPAPAAATRG